MYKIYKRTYIHFVVHCCTFEDLLIKEKYTKYINNINLYLIIHNYVLYIIHKFILFIIYIYTYKRAYMIYIYVCIYIFNIKNMQTCIKNTYQPLALATGSRTITSDQTVYNSSLSFSTRRYDITK